jgi:hypothetical protein
MKKGDYFLKKYRKDVFHGFTFKSQWYDILECEERSIIFNNNVVKPDNLFEPNETNTRKRYRVNDKVYVMHGKVFHYGEVRLVTPETYVIDHDGWKTYPRSTFIIPSNWWLLENNCKRSLYVLGICLKRLGVYRDLRILICKHVWATKNDEEWGIFKK